jgi:hypothetical protein
MNVPWGGWVGRLKRNLSFWPLRPRTWLSSGMFGDVLGSRLLRKVGNYTTWHNVMEENDTKFLTLYRIDGPGYRVHYTAWYRAHRLLGSEIYWPPNTSRPHLEPIQPPLRQLPECYLYGCFVYLIFSLFSASIFLSLYMWLFVMYASV